MLHVIRERLRLLAIGHYVYGGMRLFMLPFFVAGAALDAVH